MRRLERSRSVNKQKTLRPRPEPNYVEEGENSHLCTSKADVFCLLPSSNFAATHFSIHERQERRCLCCSCAAILCIPSPTSGGESDSAISTANPLLQHALQFALVSKSPFFSVQENVIVQDTELQCQ